MSTKETPGRGGPRVTESSLGGDKASLPRPHDGMSWNECRELARSMATAGIPAFPIALKWNHDKGKIDKRPLTPRGHHDATTNPGTLEDLFREHVKLRSGEWPGVGLWVGPAGYLVLDVDDHTALDRLEAERGAIPGRRVNTPSGGLHIYMKLPEDVTIGQRSPWPGIDIRSSKGWLVAPGVSTPWGKWEPDQSTSWADAPQWIIDAITTHELKVTTQRTAPLVETGGKIPPGGRNDALFREARSMNRRGWTLEATIEALSVFNEKFCDPPHPRSEVERAAVSAFSQYEQGPPPGDSDRDDHDHDRRVRLLCASQLTPENVEWFEDGLIPLRVVTLVAGVDGVGKSTILYTKAALATRGELPGAFYGTPVNVVIASVEDHPQSVILPRLIAAGADLDRVHIIKVEVDGLDGEINLPDDLPAVSEAVASVEARLLIIDPLIAYMPLNIDSHKAQHIRSVIAPLARLAEDERLAVAAVVHFNGSPSADVRTRISGSKAIRDAARSVIVCGEDPDDETRFIMVQDKNSFGPKSSTGTAYTIESAAIRHNGEEFLTSKVRWLGEVPITARQMLTGPKDKADRTERDIAKEVIVTELKERPLRWADLEEVLSAQGVTQITARRARDDLKAEGVIELVTKGWLWTLITPPDQSDGDQGSKPPLTWENAGKKHDLDHSLEGDQGSLSEPLCTVCDRPGDLEEIRGERMHRRCRPAGWLAPEEIAP